MSRARFGTLLALLGLAVAAASFLLAGSVLDDGQPDPPPRGTTESDGDALGSDPVVTTPTTAAPATDTLTPPAWIAVVASETDEAGATADAQAVTAAGHAAGVLRSDDYPSLSPGLWVAYAGPYPDSAAAEAAVGELAADGFDGAYARCAGTEDECGTQDDDD